MQETTECRARWYAVQTQPNREFLAQTALGSVEGVQTYMPTLHVTPVNPRSRRKRAFFPGYLFVQADLKEIGVSALQWRPGVRRVVGLGDVPVAIPESVIVEIRDRVRRAQQEDPLSLGGGAYLNPGDPVRITSGSLEGYEGMFDLRLGGQTRARILVEFMGRELAAEVDLRSLEKIERGRKGTARSGRNLYR